MSIWFSFHFAKLRKYLTSMAVNFHGVLWNQNLNFELEHSTNNNNVRKLWCWDLNFFGRYFKLTNTKLNKSFFDVAHTELSNFSVSDKINAANPKFVSSSLAQQSRHSQRNLSSQKIQNVNKSILQSKVKPVSGDLSPQNYQDLNFPEFFAEFELWLCQNKNKSWAKKFVKMSWHRKSRSKTKDKCSENFLADCQRWIGDEFVLWRATNQ